MDGWMDGWEHLPSYLYRLPSLTPPPSYPHYQWKTVWLHLDERGCGPVRVQ